MSIDESYIKNHGLTGDEADATMAFLKSQTGIARPTREEISLVNKTIGRDGMKRLRTHVTEINNATDKSRCYIETFTLDKSAKIASYHDIYAERSKYASQFSGSEYRKFMKMDIGSFAAMKGYDAVNVEGSNSYVIVLNRTKVIFNGG